MKKILILILCCTFLLGLFGCGNKKDDLDENVETNQAINKEEAAVESNEYQFIFDFFSFTDDWWKEKNESNSIGDFVMTNKDVFELCSSKDLGNVCGQLSLKPIDFQVPIVIENTSNDNYYIINFTNNKFIFPQELKMIDSKLNNVSSMLTLSLIDNKLMPYVFNLKVDSTPTSLKNKVGDWVELNEKQKTNNSINVDDLFTNKNDEIGEYRKLYYVFDEKYCLSLSTNSNIYMKNAEMTAGVEDIESFINNFLKTVSIEKVEKQDAVIKIFEDNVILSNGTEICLNNKVVERWTSGASNVTSGIFEKDNVISIYNQNGHVINIREYDKEKDIDELLHYLGLTKEEYDYRGKKIYLCKYSDDVISQQQSYVSFMFEVDNVWYNVDYQYDMQIDQADVNAWIDKMIEGVININNKNSDSQ